MARASAADVVVVDPKATYLLTNEDPNAQGAVPVDLESAGLRPGDSIAFQARGDFCFSVFNPMGCAATELERPMVAVFSGTSTLLPSHILHRVPDAIPAGSPVTTFATLFGGIPTNIAEDFQVAHAPFWNIVTIPDDARFLFIAVSDSFYGDNDDPDSDLAVGIAKVPSRIAFNVNSETVSGTGNGAVQMLGGGSFDIDRHAVAAAGTFRCTQAIQLGLVECAAGQGLRWNATNLLNSLFFRCTTSSTEAFKQAFTGATAVALLADLFPRGEGAEPALAVPLIVASIDIAPDIAGTQNVWIAGIGCGSAAVNFNAD